MRLGVRKTAVVGLAIVLLAACAWGQVAPPPDLDAWVTRAMKTFEVPGLALAIVKDGQVVVAKGYGVRKMGAPQPVDENTLFGIASNTKAFTAAALAMLVDEGKLDWDDPVTKHLPWFQLYDPWVTRELTVRDLLTHRSGLGLGAGDLLFFPHTTYTRGEILRRLRAVRPATSFRSRYAYDNVLYLAAGEIVAAVSGKSWDDFIRERFFVPLGMTHSNTSVKQLASVENKVAPTSRLDGELRSVDFEDLDNLAPAGSINSCVSDMSKWLLAQLAQGKLAGGPQLFSARQSREMWAAQTITPIGQAPDALKPLQARFAAYGLGWGLRDYLGRKVVSHGGGLTGMVSRVLMVPEENLGLVILTNQEENVMDPIAYHIVDHYLKAPPTDWIAAFKTVRDKQLADAAEVERKQQSARAADSHPSLPLEKYAGDYTDAWYGDMNIRLENAKLVMRFGHTPSMVGDLEHWQYDTFKAHWRERTVADAFVTFALKADGSIEQIKMLPVSPLADFSFDYQDLLFTPVKKK